MEKAKQFGRILYALAMAGVGIQQLCYQNFVAMIFPAWPHPFWGYAFLSILCSLSFIAIALAIILKKDARRLCLLLGTVLLLFTIFSQIPFLYAVVPHKKSHLGVWVFVLKDLALAGGAFTVAGSFPKPEGNLAKKKSLDRFLEPLIPLGPVFFSITMIEFGRAHYLYADGMTNLVPSYLPGAFFWVYFTGTALILSGIAIILRIATRIAAFLLGSMIFIWFWLVHLPNVLRNLYQPGGNEITAALSAMAFSGIAFTIAGVYGNRKRTKAAIQTQENFFAKAKAS